MKSFLIYFLIKSFLSIFAVIPLKVTHKIGTLIGWLLYYFNTKARKISQLNIAYCLPELSQKKRDSLVKNSLISMGKSITELGYIWSISAKNFNQCVTVEGKELIDSARKSKQGIILITPHLGCWEVAGLYLSMYWPQALIFYQPPKIEYLDNIIIKGRTHFGAKLIPTNKKGLIQLLKALRSGQVTGLLPDQTPKDTNSGTFAPFFNQSALTMNLIANLSRKSNAQVFMCYAKRLEKGQGYKISVYKTEADINHQDPLISATALNKSVEQLIRQEPEQYLWSYKRFKQIPPSKDDNIQKVTKNIYDIAQI